MVKIKNIRLQDYDYSSNGYYFVTISCAYKQGFLKGKEQIITEELVDLIKKTNGLTFDYYVIMPNHIHLIFVFEGCKIGLGEIVRKLKAKISHRLNQKIWQPNYYEHVIRNEKALEKIREYIVNNPLTEVLKFDQFYID